MANKTIKILIIAVIIIFVVSFLYGLKNKDEMMTNSDSLNIFKEDKNSKTDSLNYSNSKLPMAPSRMKKYASIQHGFSFKYPANFSIYEFPEENGKVALIIKNSENVQIIQIYMTPHGDLDFYVNAERIQRDLPDLMISNSTDVIVGGKAKGVAFFSDNEAFGGDTAEVWFADKSKFYQATCYRKDVKLLEELIKNWEFN